MSPPLPEPPREHPPRRWASTAARLGSLALLGLLLVKVVIPFLAASGTWVRIPMVAALYLALYFVPVRSLAVEVSSLVGLLVGAGLLIAFGQLGSMPFPPVPLRYLRPVLAAIPVSLIGLAIALTLRRLPGARRAARATRHAAEAVSPAERRDAAEELVACAPGLGRAARVEALWAAVRLRLGVGDLGEAVKLLEGMDRDAVMRAEHGHRLAGLLSVVLALRGETVDASAWAAAARRRDPPLGQDPDRLNLVADAIVASRSGNAGEAATRIEEAWPKLRGAQSVPEGALQLVRAFLLARAGRGAEAPPLAAEAAASAAWVGASWPELAEFVAQLTAARTERASG